MARQRTRLSFALALALLGTCGGSARAAPPQPAASPLLQAPPSLAAQPNPATAGAVVVAVDPGHGGTNLGAAGPGLGVGVGVGVYEKRLMLALAKRLRALLAEDPPAGAPAVTVVLCRDSDGLVPIRARARCARESGARLFLSLHANAVPAGAPRGSQRGFEVFVLGPREVEDDAALAVLGQANDAEAVWAAHEVRAAGERSVLLARIVMDQLTRALGGDKARGIKQSGAALDVLRGTATAAALVEVGFIDHPEEGPLLASAEGREPIARALASAVRAYILVSGNPGPNSTEN